MTASTQRRGAGGGAHTAPAVPSRDKTQPPNATAVAAASASSTPAAAGTAKAGLLRGALSGDGNALWCPETKTVFYAAAAVRALGALTSGITDCDETFNYWEPAHQLLYGRGLQTWEYSPQYALRSYLYVGLHTLVASVLSIVYGGDKVPVFYATRGFLALLCAGCESALFAAVRTAFGPRIAIITAVFMAFSTGMFHAGSAFLPSVFAMYCVMLGYAAYLRDKPFWAIFAGAAAVIIGWPFVGLVFLPMGLHLIMACGLSIVAVWTVLSVVVLAGMSMFVDYVYYRKIVLAAWNIVLYNVLGGGGGSGSNLYGVEPVTFYFKNLFLNFNVAFGFALLSIPAVAYLTSTYLRHCRRQVWVTAAGFWIWFLFMTAQAHKEERFMFVVYPLLAVCAAFTVDTLLRMRTWIPASVPLPGVGRILRLIFIAFMVLTVSRTMSLTINYRSSMLAWTHVNNYLQRHTVTPIAGGSQVNVCVGKEWYRFPGSFFLPDSPKPAKLQFLEAGFHGQLPQAYSAQHGTWGVQPGFNDLNQEEKSRYMHISQCDLVVELELEGDEDPFNLHDTSKWGVVWEGEFLDAARSPMLTRSLWLVEAALRENKWGNYKVYHRI